MFASLELIRRELEDAERQLDGHDGDKSKRVAEKFEVRKSRETGIHSGDTAMLPST